MAEEESSNEYDNEIFIDADSGFQSEKNSYENLILRQMLECAKVMSREMTGGQVIHKTNKSGSVEKYIEDVRELVINHVDTLKMLMCTYIKDHNKEQMNIIIKEIEDYKNEVGRNKVLIPLKGEVMLKDIKGMDVRSPIWVEFINFKANKYREVFEILVNSYNEQKAYIRSLEEE